MSERPGSAGFGRGLTVRELLDHSVMSGAELVGGGRGLDQGICALNVMTRPDIGDWVKPDEFLLVTGYPLPRDDAGQAELLRDLHRLGLAGIGVKLDRYLPDLSAAIVSAAEELGMPLILIPERIRFDDILSHGFSTIVNRQAAALERAHELHQSFLGVTLSGGGLDELARQLSTLLGGATVVVCDQQGAIRAQAGEADRAVEAGIVVDGLGSVDRLREAATGRGEPGTWIARAVRAGTLQHGYVAAVEATRTFGELEHQAVEQAAVVAALEFTRDLAVNAVERQFSSNALYELMTGAESEVADAAARGFGFGWDLDRPVVVLVTRKHGQADAADNDAQSRLANERALEFWISAVHSQDRKAAAAGLGSELVAVIGAEHGDEATVRAIQGAVGQFVRGGYSTGVSRVHPGPLGIPHAYQEARVALRVGEKVGGHGDVTAYDNLGLFKLLAQIEDPELQAFADETLGPLTSLQEPERSELLKTLETLVEHNMNMAETARHLHYHYNTLRYRLAKLEKLLGPFSSSTAVAVKVFVALQIRQMHAFAPPANGS